MFHEKKNLIYLLNLQFHIPDSGNSVDELFVSLAMVT